MDQARQVIGPLVQSVLASRKVSRSHHFQLEVPRSDYSFLFSDILSSSMATGARMSPQRIATGVPKKSVWEPDSSPAQATNATIMLTGSWMALRRPDVPRSACNHRFSLPRRHPPLPPPTRRPCTSSRFPRPSSSPNSLHTPSTRFFDHHACRLPGSSSVRPSKHPADPIPPPRTFSRRSSNTASLNSTPSTSSASRNLLRWASKAPSVPKPSHKDTVNASTYAPSPFLPCLHTF